MLVNNTYRMAKLMAGAALIALMASQAMAQAVPEDDTTVWAGGDPDFDESAGGGVIDEPGTEPEVLVDPIEGWDGGTVEEGVVDGGGDCEACFNIGEDPEPAAGNSDGASAEVVRSDVGTVSPGKRQAQSNASEDNAECIARVGRAQAHRCMN